MSTVKLAFRKFTNGVSDSVNDGQKKVKSVGPKAGHKINGQSLNDRGLNDDGEQKSKNQRKKQLKEDEKRERRGSSRSHTPKLQGGATESGASVFQVAYFGREAFLAQLAKQMCVAADFEKLYEVGPLFRAKNSNTHRHLTEYTGLDLEIEIQERHHEVLHVIDDTLKAIFKGVYERNERDGILAHDFQPA
ncbi:hypothetical protein FRB97_005739 [Tulasnella sp. 331]|nr:hypothetical protein FRB97_005739 [Tulasnella sp. 331]